MKKHDAEVIYRETKRESAAFATYWTFWIFFWLAVVVAVTELTGITNCIGS